MDIRKFISSVILEHFREQEESSDIWYHGTDELFDVPKFENGGLEPGFHLGNYNQAMNIKKRLHGRPPRYINKYKVSKINPLRVDDMLYWITTDLKEVLSKKGIEVETTGKGMWGSRYIKPEDIINALSEHGYDSLVYDNEHEGKGDSIVLFHPHQLKFINREEFG